MSWDPADCSVVAARAAFTAAGFPDLCPKARTEYEALTAVEAIGGDQGMRYQAVTGCVGDDAAHQFSKWEKTLDLPDQTLAFLGALCDRVLHHDLCRERWEAGMEVIGSMWCSWKELCIIGAQPMSAAYQAGWKIPAEYASEAMPLMVRAGMFGGLKA